MWRVARYSSAIGAFMLAAFIGVGSSGWPGIIRPHPYIVLSLGLLGLVLLVLPLLIRGIQSAETEQSFAPSVNTTVNPVITSSPVQTTNQAVHIHLESLVPVAPLVVQEEKQQQVSSKTLELSLIPHGDNSEYLYLEVVNEAPRTKLSAQLRVLSRNDGTKVKTFGYEGQWGLHPEPSGWWEDLPYTPSAWVYVGFGKSGMLQIAEFDKLDAGICSMKLAGLDERLLWDFEAKPNSILPFVKLQVEIFSEAGKVASKTYEVGPTHAYGPLGMTEVFA